MIRRQSDGSFFLIAQVDHARLAGELAKHFGNSGFSRPEPFDQVVAAVGMHDEGWPLHDERPTLNALRLPLDVFETPSGIAYKIWNTSAERAQAVDPHAGLLVSLHSLSLSTMVTAPAAPNGKHEKFDVAKLGERFELNKFQHREIERQERLRRQLGMRTDRPLKFGLAEPSADADENRLSFNFRLLQAMDLCSLAICCTEPPTTKTREVHPRIGVTAVHLSLHRSGNDLIVDPWPFDVASITVRVPYRRVPAEAFAGEEAFRAVYADAKIQSFDAKVRAG